MLIQANDDITAPALSENVPAGWTVTPVDNGGFTFNPSTLEWVYLGGWTTGSSATIIYNVTVPADAAEATYSITGEVSAYGIGPFAVGGETDITVSTAPSADLNNDGHVNVLDMIILGQHWEETPSSPSWDPKFDLNNDNIIDSGDMAIIGIYWTG